MTNEEATKQPNAEAPQAQLDRIEALRVRIVNAFDGLDVTDGQEALEEAMDSLTILYGWKWGAESRSADLERKYISALETADASLSLLVRKERESCWISTEERLPPIGERLILAFRYENGESGSVLGCLYPDGRYWVMQEQAPFEIPVTHWILLPDPPQKGESS